MIYLISYRGRGLVVFPLILLPIVVAGVFDAVFAGSFVVGFGVGFLLTGIICWLLGRQWTRQGRDDRFCGASVQTWGAVWGVIGLLLLLGLLNRMRLDRSLTVQRRPLPIKQAQHSDS